MLPAPRFDPGIDRGLPAVLAGVVAGGLVGLLLLRRTSTSPAVAGRSSARRWPRWPACCRSAPASPRAGKPAPGRPDDPAGLPPAATALPPEVPAGLARLRPAAAVALTIALTAPAAYVLTNALTG